MPRLLVCPGGRFFHSSIHEIAVINLVHVLLVENTSLLKPRLEKSLSAIKSARFKIEAVDARFAGVNFYFAKRPTDVVLFSNKLSPHVVANLARAYRAQGHAGHLIMLTQQSEARVPLKLKNAGIEDILNVVEIETPVFGWTFISAVLAMGMKKKAEGYEDIQQRLQLVNNALDHLTKSMSEPLESLHKVSEELGKNGRTKIRPGVLRRHLAENVASMDRFMKELLDIGARLGKETRVMQKVLSVKTGR